MGSELKPKVSDSQQPETVTHSDDIKNKALLSESKAKVSEPKKYLDQKPPVERKKTYREQQEEEKARKASVLEKEKRESEEKAKQKAKGYKPKKKSEVRSSSGRDSMSE